MVIPAGSVMHRTGDDEEHTVMDGTGDEEDGISNDEDSELNGISDKRRIRRKVHGVTWPHKEKLIYSIN